MPIDIPETAYFALIQRVRALEDDVEQLRRSTEDHITLRQPVGDSSGWSGIIRVAGKIVASSMDDITGDDDAYVRIFFDGTTPPEYTDLAAYLAVDWGDDSKVIPLEALYATVGDYNIDRA